MAALTALFIWRLFLQEAEGIFDGEESGVLDLGRTNTLALEKKFFYFIINSAKLPWKKVKMRGTARQS